MAGPVSVGMTLDWLKFKRHNKSIVYNELVLSIGVGGYFSADVSGFVGDFAGLCINRLVKVVATGFCGLLQGLACLYMDGIRGVVGQ